MLHPPIDGLAIIVHLKTSVTSRQLLQYLILKRQHVVAVDFGLANLIGCQVYLAVQNRVDVVLRPCQLALIWFNVTKFLNT